MVRRHLVLVIVFGIFLSDATYTQPITTKIKARYTIDHTVYGAVSIDDPLVIDLLNSPTMQRIKSVHQYGISWYNNKEYSFSRYDHCVGVYLLLKRFGLTREEQVAGLLHDASHTAFSHVAEYVFGHSDYHNKHSYQDMIHRSFLEQQGIPALVKKYGLTLDDVMHKDVDATLGGTKDFRALEQDLPDMCADRIDYNLQGGVLENVITTKDVQKILKALRWNGKDWYFTDVKTAKLFAKVPLHLTENTWGSAAGAVTYTWASQAIKRAFELGIITKEEFHTGTDDAVGAKLDAADDPNIKMLMQKIKNYRDYFSLSNEKDYDQKFKQKFRGIDPLVKTKKGFKRLTALDATFAQEYNNVRNRMERGWFVKYHSDDEVK